MALATLLMEELRKPVNGTDLLDLENARVEVGKLRALVRELARISVEDSPGSVESKGEAIKAFEQARAAEDDDVSDDLGSTQSWAGLRTDPTVALLRLKVGNARFVSGHLKHPHEAREWRHGTCVGGQHPYCTVLACSDSRAPVPLLFDAGVGDIFCVSVAGNVLSHTGLASIEYGVGHLRTPVLLVLGHYGCGAVTAVVKHQKVDGAIPHLLSLIEPARTQAAEAHPNCADEDLLPRVVESNIWLSVEHIITNSSTVRGLVLQDKVLVEAAVYDMEEGRVHFLGTHPRQAEILGTCSS